MTSSTGSISVSGLLGGTAGQIDTNALIASLMQAQSIPQTQLKNQLNVQQAILSADQAINTKLTALQTAAQALTDPGAWTATAATSSSGSVVASSDGTAVTGSTTFDVLQTAAAQLSTVAADVNGVVVSNPAAVITITDSSNVAHTINLTSGTATDVAAAINAANVGVRASVVTTTTGQRLQLLSSTTGAAASFGATGFDSAASTVVPARDAQIGVGDPLAGGYVVSSPTNTFSSYIPGVTFTVSAPATGVTISVASDSTSISNKVAALVKAMNAGTNEIDADTGKGAILQGRYEVSSIASSLRNAVAGATTSLKQYGVDMDKNGVVSFDAAAFATAYAKDPAGTKAALSAGFATTLNSTVSQAIAPVTGTIAASITSATNQSTELNKQIDAWTTRLATIQTTLQAKYTAMETALGKLQSQNTYLTNMLKSMSSGSGSSSN